MIPSEVEAAMEAYAGTLGPDAAPYWERHRRRFQYLVADAARRIRGGDIRRVLDVGASFQTLMLRRLFPGLTIDTLGFADSRYLPGQPGRHLEFDLNQAADPAGRLPSRDGSYDLILFLEVIEHLHIAPCAVLRLLADLLEPGGVMLLTTPNALWLKNRVKLLCGRHPFEMIRESRTNPGHFREYTADELCDEAWKAGLAVESRKQATWYHFASAKDRAYARVAQWLGPNFRRDLLLVLRRPASAPRSNLWHPMSDI